MQRDLPQILWDPLLEEGVEQDCACSTDRPVIWEAGTEASRETDCACPETSAPVSSPFPSAAGLWRRPSDLYRAPLPDAHELTFNPAGPAGVVVLNEPATYLLDSFATPHPLTSPTSRQLASLGLLTPACATESGVRDTPHTLTAWLHVTNRCNLHCAYCYVRQSDEGMDERTGRAAVEATVRSAVRHGFRAVKFKYAGGEPTLNWALVQSLHRHAAERTARAGLELHEVLLSNGTLLTTEMLDWLRDAGVRLMVSLDGIGAAHDAQRHFADGRGSFALVARTIERAVARGLSPYVSVTVTPDSAAALPETVAFILEHDLPFNLNFVRGEGDVTPADKARLIEGVQAAFAVIGQALPRRRLLDGLLDRSFFGAAHTHPCGAGRSYLVIGPQGRIARCQMEMERAVTDVWADDPLLAVRQRQDGFQNVPVESKESCRDCPWRYWCAGGCPLLAYRTTGRSDTASPYCEVYRALYPALLRLEGLRLLKWSPPVA